MEYVRTQFDCYISCVWYLHSRSAVGKHVKSMQKIPGSNLVCTFFESRYLRYVPIHTSMYWYVLVYTSMYWYILVYFTHIYNVLFRF